MSTPAPPRTTPLTDQQAEYNTSQAELFQLAVYGHFQHWPTGTGHPSEYIKVVRAAQERFERAMLAVMKAGLDRLAAAARQQAEAELGRVRAELAAVREGAFTEAIGISMHVRNTRYAGGEFKAERGAINRVHRALLVARRAGQVGLDEDGEG